MKTKASILIYIFTIMALVFTNSCSKDDTPTIEKETPKSIPVLTTAEVKDITGTTANTGGNITNDGGAAVTARGVCWGTNQTPTINDNKTSDGNGNGSFISNITNLTPNTTYYVRAYATNSEGTGYGNSISLTTKEDIKVPTLSTAEVTEVTEAGAVSGGNITDDGGATVSARGVCWSTEDNPTIEDNKTTDGTGAGTFSSTLSNLKSETTYYVRSYATNSGGTGYGSTMTFTTLPDNSFVDKRDNNIYKFVTIGKQTWMAENLKYLPSVVGPEKLSTTEAHYYVYDYKGTNVTEAKATENYKIYGVLYNWTAAMAGEEDSPYNPSGVQGICPDGWHLPSEAEWNELSNNLGKADVAGGKLKEAGTNHWLSPNKGATNESGFTALPGGHLEDDGQFWYIGEIGLWWTATQISVAHEGTTHNAWGVNLHNTKESIRIDFRNTYLVDGKSIRCVRD